MNAGDFYAILNVAPTSDEVVIRAAYKALMRKYHPDTNGSADATARAAVINEAFEVLSDPQRRAAYDRERASKSKRPRGAKKSGGGARPSSPPPAPPSPPHKRPTDSARDPGSSENQSGGQALLGVLIVGALLVIAIVAGHRPAGSNADNNSAAIDTTYDANAADMSMDTNMTMDVNMATANPSASANGEFINSLGSNSQTFPNAGPPPPLEYADIQFAARQFEQTLRRSGIFGAHAFSERCHNNARRELTWQAFDRCAAFDFAAAYIDGGMVSAAGISRNSYFEFMESNAADQYVALSSLSYSVSQRLRAIQQAVRPAVTEEIEARLAETSVRPRERASGSSAALIVNGSSDPGKDQ